MKDFESATKFQRTEMLIGQEGLEELRASKVAIFGVGGVGGYAVEALARSGIGHLTIIDGDVVDITNINRQLIATLDSIGKPKVEVFKSRIETISPETEVTAIHGFYKAGVGLDLDFSAFDYVVDAIDTVSAKIDIIKNCTECGTPIISAMGCGNRLDPTKLIVTDIHKTEMDPLAKVVRQELRKLGIKKLKVVASTEAPLKPAAIEVASADEGAGNSKDAGGRTGRTPGSTAFVPGAAGLIIASQVVRDLLRS